MWSPSLAQNRSDTGRACLGHFYENAFMSVRDHCPAVMKYGSDEMMGRSGLEPGTNPESFRGCCYSAVFSVSFNAKIASCGFFLRFS
jgi:hypothetical protein